MGDSEAPWENLPIDMLQECVNIVYLNLDYVVERGDALVSSVSCSASFVSISPFNKSFFLTGKSTNDELSKHHWKHCRRQHSKVLGKIQDP